MNFSEDSNSPAAPFSGDNSGQIFDLPDMVAVSPTTAERVVDTQSGYLVVIKKFNDKLALSVKRRIGTPPSSSVSLTPDESVKLSKILSSSFSLADGFDWSSSDQSQRVERRGGERRREERRRMLSVNRPAEVDDDEPRYAAPAESAFDSELPEQAQVPNTVNLSSSLMLATVLRRFMVPIIGIGLSVFVLGIGAGITGVNVVFHKSKVMAPVVTAAPDVLDSKHVESFTRDFVGRMLDFSSTSYRISQVQAMAAMTPELLERYWTETKFPLTKRQLAKVPQGTSIMIADLKQERLDANTVQVDVKAEMSDAKDPKVITPVNLRLKLTRDANNQIIVLEQQDLAAVDSTK